MTAPDGLASGVVTGVVIGAVGSTGVAAAVSFLEVFGFVVVAETDVTTVAMPGGAPVGLDIVRTPHRAPRPGGYRNGPRALDLYTSDLGRALTLAATRGYPVSPIGTISLGPVTMRQALVSGPGGVDIVLVESTHRRSSLLDIDPDRLFSEPHSVVWCVADLDAEAEFWVDSLGCTPGSRLAFSEPAVSEYLGLADSPVDIAMTMLSDRAVSPIRLELLEFVGRSDAESTGPQPDDDRLHEGIWAIAIDPPRGRDSPPAVPSSATSPTIRRSPGGIRYRVTP